MKKRFRKTMATVLSLAMVLSLVNVQGSTSMAEETELSTEAVTEAATETYVEYDTSADANEAEEVYEEPVEDSWEEPMEEASDTGTIAGLSEEGSAEEYEEEEAAEEAVPEEEAWDGYFTGEHPEWGGIMETAISGVAGSVRVNIPAGAFTEAVTLSADAQVYAPSAAYDSSVLSMVLTAAEKSLDDDVVYNFYTLNLTFYNEYGQAVYPNGTISVQADMSSNPTDLGAGSGNAAAIEKGFYYANESTGAAERLWEAVIHVNDYNQISGLEFSASQFSSPYVLLMTEPKESTHTVTFDLDEGEGARVVAGDTELTETGTADAENGTIVFSVLMDDEDYEVDSVLVDGSIEARKNETTDSDDDYIIEGIETDETIVSVKTKEKDDDELVEQTLYATIFTDASYTMESADSTSIILSGLMPKDAFVKAYSVDVEIEGVNVLAAYDISIFDTDGDEFEPEGDSILVEINNAEIQEALDDDLELTVYHMEDEADEPEEIAVMPESADIVTFSADQFSIYVVGEGGTLTGEDGAEVTAYTVCFYEWVYDETELGEPEIAEEKVVGNDYLNEPEVPEIEHHVFDGWFTEEQDVNHYGDGEYPGYKYDFSLTVKENLDSWDDYSVGEGNVINLYSDYDPIYYVYYMTEEQFDESGNKTNEDVVVFTDEYHENNSVLDTSNAESIYQQSHLGAEQAVTSWYYYDENGVKQDIVSGTTITDGMELYPVVQDVIWVYFYLGEEAGENVEAIEPMYVAGDATVFGELPVPEMAGYEFAGWYFQGVSGSELIEATSNPQDYITEEKKDIDLYASWTPANVGYTVNIWRQKATDGQEGIDQKTVQNGEGYSTYINYYDYAESYTVSAEQSQLKTGDTPTTATVDNWSTYIRYGWTTGNNGSDGTGDYVGFEYNQTRTENDLATITVKSDGSTIINIFYDRVTVTYHFGTSTNADSTGTLIGLYDTNTKVADNVTPGGTLNGWPSPGDKTEWRYVTGRSGINGYTYTGMSFLAKFALTDNYSYRTNVVYFTSNSTSYSATLYYYLEVTNPEKQVTDSSQTTTVNGTTYVLDYTLSFGKSASSSSFTITDKYIGYTAVGFKTSANGDYQKLTSQNNPVTLNNNGTLYIFNDANTYYIDLYSNHDGEQLIESFPIKYGEDLASYEFPEELEAEQYGPNYYYHFTGTWYEDPTFTAEFVKPYTMPANNLSAYADWELNEVTVTFQSNVESDLYSQLVDCYGAENVTTISEGKDDGWAYSVVITAGDQIDYKLDIGFAAEEEAEGHVYEYGGLLNVDTNKVFNFASQIYTDTTLQLFWIEAQTVYHLQYNLNQGEGGTVTEVLGHGHESTSWAEVRELVDVFEDVDDDDFICWNTEPDGSGTNFYPDDDVDFTKVAAEPVYDEETGELLYYVYNLYAIWAEEKTASLDLEYNYPEGYEADETSEYITESNLNSISLSEYTPEETRITITNDDGTETIYEFAGWAYSADATQADISADGTVAVDNVNEQGNVLYAVWLALEPDWTVEKTLTNSGSGESGAFKAGETATFTITVTNTGDEAIELIEVTEALEGATFVESTDGSYTLNEDKTVATITDLAAGSSVEIQATYTVTQEDVASGEELANSITTEGGDPDDPIPGPGDKEPIPTEDPNPSLSVEKTSDVAEGEVAELGQEITYTIVVTNDGNVTLTGITVTDDLTTESWSIDSLAPGEDATFTTIYVVTEDDIISGSIENVATATAPNPNYDPDDPESPENIEGEGEEEVTTEEENPLLTVSKVVDSTPANGTAYDLGEEIIWKITVTNGGNLTISDIVVTDELTGDTWTVEGTLAPGESTTFTASHVVTEADIEAGDVFNEATASGSTPDPENPDVPVIPGDDDEPTVTPGPSLYVEKTADVDEDYLAKAGDEITYTIYVLNNGNVTLTGINVTDDLTGESWTIDSLAPGEDKTFTTTYTVTEDDIIAGSIENIATATAPNPEYDPSDPDSPEKIEDSDKENVTTEDADENWTADKTLTNADEATGADGKFAAGDVAKFTITVKNIGNVTIKQIVLTEELEGAIFVTGEGYTVSDDGAVATITDLAAGASVELYAEYKIQEKDLGKDLINSVSTDDGDPENPTPGPTPVEPIPTEDVNPSLSVEKTSDVEDGEEAVLHQVITYTIVVTNDGNVTFTNITVTDDLTRESWIIESLAPGEVKTFTTTYEVTEDDIIAGSVANVATATAPNPNYDPDDPDSPENIEGEDEEEVKIEDENPHLTVSKDLADDNEPANGTAYDLGEEIIWIITVTNDGNLTISDIVVTDELTGDTWTVDGTLEPGEGTTFEASHIVDEADIERGYVHNEATATGKSPDPENPDVPDVPGEDDEPTVTPGPSLYVEKTADVEDGEVVVSGQDITYTIYVLNNGNITLTGITVADDLTGESWTIDSLAPGEDATFTTTYTVSEEDIVNGSIENVAIATAPNPEYDPDDPDSPENIEGRDDETVTTEEEDPHLTVTKEATSTPANGETYALDEEITWDVTVTNDGNLNITDIVITDELTGDTWEIESLAPGESKTFEASYTVTREDLENGSVINEAKVEKGTTPDPKNPDVPSEPGSDEQSTDEPEEFYPLDEEIVPGADDEASPDTWVKNEGVTDFEAIEIEMSTTLPKVSVTSLENEEYKMTFHVALDDGLVLRPDDGFIIDINGEPISSDYVVDTITTNSLLQFFSVSDGCAFHVDVDLSALYADGIITEEDLGTATIRIFFYVDLETDDVAGVYTSTAWYDVTENGEVVYTSNESVVDLYTFEILINKYDMETGDPLSGATFGLYTDEACTDPVVRDGESLTVTTDGDGMGAFIGFAGIYYVKELSAPDGYDPISAAKTVTLEGSEDGDHIQIVNIGNTPTGYTIPAERMLTVIKNAVSTPANGTAYVEGETITYSITVVNDTDVTIGDIEVKDNLTGDVWTVDSLAPGEEKTFTTEYTVTKDDVAAGNVVNVATASGVSDSGESVSGGDTEEAATTETTGEQTGTGTADTTDSGSTGSRTESVKTGDNTPIAPIVGIMAAALALCLGAFTYRRRRVYR